MEEQEINYDLNIPKQSKTWECWLFGSKSSMGFVYHPSEGDIPNPFIRWMMKVFLGCRWVRI